MRINLDHWFANDNSVSISLMNFYCAIKIVHNGDFIYYPVTIYDSNRKTLRFNFYTLEDAIMFVEGLNNMFTLDEVLESYLEQIEKGAFKSNYGVKRKTRR